MNKLVSYFVVLSALIYISNTLQKSDYAPDDTFIYMQYAKNIASGGGFSFNSGEPSFGVTSPLWVFMLTVPYYVNVDPFWFAKSLDVLFFLLSAILFYYLAKIFLDGNKSLALLAVSVYLLDTWLKRWSFTGMETSLAACLVLLAFYLYYNNKNRQLFFVLGALQLTRPETFVLTMIFFVFVLHWKIRSKSFRYTEILLYVLCFAILTVPFYTYAKFSFGTIVPNTVLGKSTLTLSFSTIVNQIYLIAKTLAASNIIEIVLSLILIIFFFRKVVIEKVIAASIWIAGLIILYVVTDADIISRYLVIISPFFILIGFILFTKVKDLKPVIIIVTFIVYLGFSQIMFYRVVKPSTDNFTIGVETCLIPTGKWLNENTPLGSRILVNDVGAIGYYSGRYIIDAAALINSDLELNRKIMSTPVEKRITTHKLLGILNADYVIDRDADPESGNLTFENKNLIFIYMRVFPGLGIKDNSPRYYKVYKVENK